MAGGSRRRRAGTLRFLQRVDAIWRRRVWHGRRRCAGAKVLQRLGRCIQNLRISGSLEVLETPGSAWIGTFLSGHYLDNGKAENSPRNANQLHLKENRRLKETTESMEKTGIRWVVSISWKYGFASETTISLGRSPIPLSFQARGVTGIHLIRFPLSRSSATAGGNALLGSNKSGLTLPSYISS